MPRKKERQYRVVWQIDLYAKTPEEAAEEALRIQRDPDSLATVFNVTEDRGRGKTTVVDLYPE